MKIDDMIARLQELKGRFAGDPMGFEPEVVVGVYRYNDEADSICYLGWSPKVKVYLDVTGYVVVDDGEADDV